MISPLRHQDHDRLVQTTCGNCGATLHGPFCHVCGQKAMSADLSLHEVFHEAFHELAHVDGKIVQTVRLLIRKPGALTIEFLGGRRARYISPLRLYLTFSVLFFALSAVVPDYARRFIKVTPTKSSASTPAPSASEQARNEEMADRLREGFFHNLPRAMFLLMPVFALLTWMFYRRAQPYYVAHLYYSIHFHAFVFLALTVAVALTATGSFGSRIAALAPLAFLAYHYTGIRRVFGGSRLQTAWKATAIGMLYVIIMFTVMAAEFMLLLKQQGIV